MIKFNEQFPNYDFISNKGYGTKNHLKSLRIHGYCEIHRKTFKNLWIDEHCFFSFKNFLRI